MKDINYFNLILVYSLSLSKNGMYNLFFFQGDLGDLWDIVCAEYSIWKVSYILQIIIARI